MAIGWAIGLGSAVVSAGEPPLPEHRPPLIITQGEQRLITLPGLKRYSLGSGLLRALPAPGNHDALLLKAVQPGITDLWVWKSDGSTEHHPIEVRAWKRGLTGDLERRLCDLREVEVWIVGDPEKSKASYVLHGEVRSEREARVIGRLLESFPSEIDSRTVPSEALYRSGERALRAWLEKSGKKEDLELVADESERRLIVRGGFQDPRSRAVAERSVRAAFPLVDLEIDALPDRNPTIHFKVFLLELRKNRSRAIGLEFPSVIPNALRVSSLGVRTAVSLEAAIHAMEQDGSARVLSQPELVVRAPGEAELFAGGEFPVESKTVYSSRVEWRSYGLTLKLKVQAASGRRVRADVHTEVSHLDGDLTGDRLPGLKANRMKTQVDATFGKPLLLSGLLQEGMREAAKGLPFLKSVPVLGLLFGSQEYVEDRSELVAILLPSREVPEAPRVAAGIETPEGRVPIPRDWVSPEEEKRLRSSASFPWNAFGDPGAPAPEGSSGPASAGDFPAPPSFELADVEGAGDFTP
jgi:Flp pilus assembly secretin CpaC